MASSVMFLFVAAVLAVNSAHGLVCYKCDSSESKTCNYGIASLLYATEDCSAGSALSAIVPKQCVKIVAKSKSGDEYVARGCMPYLGPACNGLAKTLGFFSSLEGDVEDISCYPCDGDKCNSSQKIKSFSFAAIIIAVLAFLF